MIEAIIHCYSNCKNNMSIRIWPVIIVIVQVTNIMSLTHSCCFIHLSHAFHETIFINFLSTFASVLGFIINYSILSSHLCIFARCNEGKNEIEKKISRQKHLPKGRHMKTHKKISIQIFFLFYSQIQKIQKFNLEFVSFWCKISL